MVDKVIFYEHNKQIFTAHRGLNVSRILVVPVRDVQKDHNVSRYLSPHECHPLVAHTIVLKLLKEGGALCVGHAGQVGGHVQQVTTLLYQGPHHRVQETIVVMILWKHQQLIIPYNKVWCHGELCQLYMSVMCMWL